MDKFTDDEYEQMSRDIETGNYTVRGPAEMGRTLHEGRPIKPDDTD